MSNNMQSLISVSQAEADIISFLEEHGVSSILRNWNISNTSIRIYLPDFKVGIEYMDIQSHSSNLTSTDSAIAALHLNKTDICDKAGIQLLHILDVEWSQPIKQTIWKSVILHKIHKTQRRIYARKCQIAHLSHACVTEFLTNNHLQGSSSTAERYGLYYQGELVLAMTFAKTRFRKTDDYEIVRAASLTNCLVVGGFEKLIKYFASTRSGILLSYANRRWSQGNVYAATGFTQTSVSGPCYYYWKSGTELAHRSKYMKHRLKDALPVFDASKTEVQNMYANNYRRFWDSGNLVYERNI